MTTDGEFSTLPVINLEEKIGKTVGRRTAKTIPAPCAATREDAIRWRDTIGGVRIPRGVFRFKSHEEADQWMREKIAQGAAAANQGN
ncbi:MAG: hypothetical protein AAF191_17985 [Verrucomicrobiota bacterium]